MSSKSAINYVRPFFYQKQEAAFFNEARYSIILGSTKSGKSYAALGWLFESALQAKQRGNAYWWVSPSHAQSKVMYQRLKAMVPDWLVKVNDTDLVINIIDKGSIHFKSGEKVDNLYGEDVYGLVLDEASRCREDLWTLIGSVTLATKGQVRIVGNVTGRNWFWNLYQRYLDGSNASYSCHSITCWDAIEAGVVTLEDVEEKKKQLPEQAFRMLYENIPADDGGNPFGSTHLLEACTESYQTSIDSNGNTTITRIPRGYSQHPPVCWGWDLAKRHDYTCGIALDQFGAVVRIERFQKNWEATTNTIIKLTGNLPALVDSSGVGDPIVEALQNNRPNFQGLKFTVQSKQQLLEGLVLGLQTGKVKFPDNTELKRELDNYQYEVMRDRIIFSAPPGQHDDCVTSLALAFKVHGSKPDYDNFLFGLLMKGEL